MRLRNSRALKRNEKTAVRALEAVVTLGASFEERRLEGFLAVRARDLVAAGLGGLGHLSKLAPSSVRPAS
jgi:hypothetical protein